MEIKLSFYTKHYYDKNKYNFANEVQNIFSCNDLCYLHELLPEHIKYSKLHKLGEDNKTWFHKKYYNIINQGNSKLQLLYEKFIDEEVCKYFNFKSFVYQKSPTFRVHIPSNIAVGGWHRDRDYNHSVHEINLYLPLTIAENSSTIWSESIEDKEDYQPINGKFGDIIVWNGSNLKHGNKINETGKTRVSFDFRIMSYEHYNENEIKSSVSAGKKFVIGDYFKLKEIK